MKYLFIIYFATILQLKAQQTYGGLFNDISFGAEYGLTQFRGDISDDGYFQPALSFYIDKKIDEKSGLQFEFLIGKMSGKNYFNGICNNINHITNGGIQVQHEREGEQFNTDFIEFDLNYLFNISYLVNNILGDLKVNSFMINDKSKLNRLNIFAKFGLGINTFRSLRTEIIDNIFINSYGYEWLWQNNFNQAGTKNKSWNENIGVRSVICGVITKYMLSNKIDLNLSIVNRYGSHDKWDSKINQKADVFSFYSIGASYKL